MPDWLIAWLGEVQGAFVRALASALREGAVSTLWLAFGLGALHALTPGHGKAALAAYFLGREAGIGKGLRVALLSAFLHVLSGFAIFLALRFIVGHVPSMTDRGPPAFTVFGYGLIVLAGLMMIVQSLRTGHTPDGTHSLTAGIGLLPCPLTISVLGFAWSQSSAGMVGLVLVALASGIALTIGAVALGAILGRRSLGAALGAWLPSLERWSRIIQGLAGALIVAIGLLTIARVWH
jgi:ABC-type nickel/cobalt efflux system permease component RcnA